MFKLFIFLFLFFLFFFFFWWGKNEKKAKTVFFSVFVSIACLFKCWIAQKCLLKIYSILFAFYFFFFFAHLLSLLLINLSISISITAIWKETQSLLCLHFCAPPFSFTSSLRYLFKLTPMVYGKGKYKDSLGFLFNRPFVTPEFFRFQFLSFSKIKKHLSYS